ncbi:MAG: Adenosylhopane nucleosidase, HpnG [uncultured Paraburkholderia sp.]|nr:MAG: Adenosylhopane nucleosidase, HpnG [uncultured Paraburkholderia sp.]CAH2916791.1 MAG: Adenosylhopane nucleosidase, HpnG [uncultured Paraburkholderia sp.]
MSLAIPPSPAIGRSAPPVIVVTGMAFEARIARGEGVEVIYAARADLLQRALSAVLVRGCSGIVSFGKAGGLSPDLEPGSLIVADAIEGPFGRLETDREWTSRLAVAFSAEPFQARLRRGLMAAVAAPLVSAKDKQLLHRSTGALAVDMESHIAGAAAEAHGVPFAVCRTIVDPAWRTLPSAATAGLRDDGSTAIVPILRELLRQPSQIGALLQVAADAHAAKTSLVQARHLMRTAGALDMAA